MAGKSGRFGKRAEEAGEAISRAQAVLEVLKLSKADLSAATRLVARAREVLARKEYESAHSFAARAERLASSLEERYRGAQKALGAVRGIASKAREIGFDAARFDAAIEEARRVAREGTVEDGISIPNYLQARALLDSFVNEGRELLKRAEATANEIFTAELALDALKDANGHVNREDFDRVIVGGGRTLIDRAKHALAQGDLDQAEAAAKAAEEYSKKILLVQQDALGALRDTERTISELRTLGARAIRAERLLEQGRILLKRAKLPEAKQLLERADQEAQRIAIDFHRAGKAVKEAEDSLASLARAGLLPEEAQRAIADAKRSLAEGAYERAEELAADARRALGKRAEVRERLVRTIEETKLRIDELRAVGSEYANDVEEMVVRAEREFENGDYVTSSEDLKIASLLMGPRSSPAAAHKVRPAPAGNP